ncbi:MAG: GTP 3',8-cyclase MoaA [Elusimicrobia bacterium]|nr:GTP 3',8-cyclase MoaA [Elusimicrobiota bacterium]
MTDGFGRAFHYLRLSVEDACNFRCLYCLPGGYHRAEELPPLTVDEIRRLARAFAGMGLWKIRLTGGEPTVRADIAAIAEAVARVPGIRKVSLSTNGYRLVELAAPLRRAGVSSVNVSVDSLDAARFARITGQDKLKAVWAGVERCLELGLETKINVVLMKDLNDQELGRFFELAKKLPLSVRFIELMPTGENSNLFAKSHLSGTVVVERLLSEKWTEKPRPEGGGPARLFGSLDSLGSVGVIAPYSKDFCATCNRLRVTSRGGLRLCLFAEADFSLRHLLQSDDQTPELQRTVRDLIGKKEVSHYLPEGKIGNVKHFAMMGG